nr:hypothetical protein RKE32_30675 [Streptomyces sp. Li-HN-5-13]
MPTVPPLLVASPVSVHRLVPAAGQFGPAAEVPGPYLTALPPAAGPATPPAPRPRAHAAPLPRRRRSSRARPPPPSRPR